jgi:hypothetical protein
MLTLANLNQSHNTQRKRDIKANYKAKLPLEKLVIEHEKKKTQLRELLEKRTALAEKIRALWDRIGQRKGFSIELDTNLVEVMAEHTNTDRIQIKEEADDDFFEDQTEVLLKNQPKTHWDYLIKEMNWMADDFDKESKKKHSDAKKMIKQCKKHISEKQAAQEKLKREIKQDLKRKSKFMSNIV